MHIEILSEKQQELLSFISVFKRNYYLVGGTAIALYIEQLAFHDDIDFAEPVEYMNGFYEDDQEIKKFLIEKSLEGIN